MQHREVPPHRALAHLCHLALPFYIAKKKKREKQKKEDPSRGGRGRSAAVRATWRRDLVLIYPSSLKRGEKKKEKEKKEEETPGRAWPCSGRVR